MTSYWSSIEAARTKQNDDPSYPGFTLWTTVKDHGPRIVYILRSWGFVANLAVVETDEGPKPRIYTNSGLGKYRLAKQISSTLGGFKEFLDNERAKYSVQEPRPDRVRSDIDKSVDNIRAATVRQFADWVRQESSGGSSLDLDTLNALVGIYAESVEAGRL
jgi:hypothetical protein